MMMFALGLPNSKDRENADVYYYICWNCPRRALYARLKFLNRREVPPFLHVAWQFLRTEWQVGTDVI